MKRQLLLLTMLLFSVFASAQNQKVRIDSNGRMTLSEVFRQIEQQTNMTVAYNENSIDVTLAVSSVPSEGTIQEVMDNVLKGTGMTIKVQGNIVALVQEDKEHVYTGVVKDAVAPIPGAVLMIVGGGQ